MGVLPTLIFSIFLLVCYLFPLHDQALYSKTNYHFNGHVIHIVFFVRLLDFVWGLGLRLMLIKAG